MLSLKALNKQQQAAVKHEKGPLLVVAGAGTGKTQVITTRIAYLIEKKLAKPSEIVGLTFTEKAAREMEARVSELAGHYVLDASITTFNAFGHELLQSFCFDAGFSSGIKLLSETQQLVWLREHLDELKLDYYSPVTNPEGMLADLAQYFSRLKEQLITPENYQKYAQKMRSIAKDKADQQEAKCHLELAAAYQVCLKLMHQQNLIDYADQVYQAVQLLENRPNVLKKMQQSFKYWLIDEFQDTNLAQGRLVDLLAGPEQNVMVVGDDDQSIYRFRGAALTNILEFKQRYPKAKQLALIQNYRSSQQILDSAHQLIQHNNPERLEAKYNLNKRLVAQFNAKPPQLMHFSSYEEEAAWIAADIKQKLKSGTIPTDIAVLLRRNSQASMLARYLETEGVEYLVVGESQDLYRQPIVKQMLNWLRVVTDPGDSTSLYHLLSNAPYQLNAQRLRELAARSRRQHVTLEELLAEESESSVTSLLQQLKNWREELPKLSVGQLLYRFLTDTKYLSQLVAGARDDPALDEQIRQLNQFFTTLLEYERIAVDGTAIGYLNSLPALLGGGEGLAANDLADLMGQKVRLITVHKAKGLEFDTVYVFDLTQGTFPSRRQAESLHIPVELLAEQADTTDAHLAEERRLMYVAMTRAKRQLYLTCSYDHGGQRPKQPSIFIEEALGSQPQLDQLKQPLARTSQIELFNSASPKQSQIKLPATIEQGDQLVLTPSQIESYLNCPAEFYLRYVLGPPLEPAFALEYGTLLHHAAQLYNRGKAGGHPPSLSQLEGYIRANWPKEGFLSAKHKQRGLKQAISTIRAFYKRQEASCKQPLYSEKAFELAMPEHKLTVKGRFDVIYQDDLATAEGVEISDYKTGAANISTQERADRRARESLQLGIYALAWQQLQGDAPARLSLDFIDSGIVGVTSKTAKQLERVQDKIAKAAKGVRSHDFKPGASHLFCTHQEFGF